jgi:uracil-DNA glycosylase family 4
MGCEVCPLNNVPGVRKLINLDRVKGRKIMVWAQGPGEQENKRGIELCGPAGDFLWSEFQPFGITREMCDLHNVVCCWPKTSEDGHTPTKQELKCCSIYNLQAVDRNQGQAVVHLILGKIAGIQLLGRAYSKAKAAIWYEPWGAYVVVADHPARILRSGGRKAGWLYFAFRDKLKAVRAILDHPGRWGYVKAQDYGAVTVPAEMSTLKAEIYKEVKAKRRVSVDIEDGIVNGKPVILMVGFGYGDYTQNGAWKGKEGIWKGKARSVVLFHPEAKQTKSRLLPLLADLKEILEDPSVLKIMQHGSYDVTQIQRLLGIHVQGYVFDTQYASYLRHSQLRTYGLDSLVGYFFQEFADYKLMVEDWLTKNGFAGTVGNFSKVPLDRLVPYNCGDCDVTKRVEAKIRDKVSLALLQVYIHTAFTLGDMEQRGPLLDREAHKKLTEAIDPAIEKLKRRLQQAAGDLEFNPNTPQQIAKLLFDKQGLPQIEGRSTGKEVLEALTMQTDSKLPRMVLDYRGLTKMKSTYLIGYLKSADTHDGELRTIWWLTGAISGRLRSGKGDQAEAEGIINMQNLHGNILLQNLLVSDKNWRLALVE